jgi:glycosyltransferase involved in cell wall biosynthesis
MHVGLNLIFLVPGETGGMEIAARELIDALARTAPPDVRFTAFVNREAAAAGGPQALGFGGEGRVAAVTVPVEATNRVQWVRGEQQLLPGLAQDAGCDVVHSLASTAPVRGRFTRVTTIHDLNYAKVPEAHFGVRALGMRALVPAAARRSHRVIVLAHSTADDLATDLKTPREKIDVVPHGVRLPDAHRPATDPQQLRAQLDISADRRVILSASAKRPHKNLLRLLDAHALLPAADRPVLVLPGYPTPHEDDLKARATALGTTADVRFLEWVGDADMDGLYALADAFVFPSLYEGFGLPVLEAMARGLPTATSDRSSLPEVTGDAGLLFDPTDVTAIATTMLRLLDDGDLRTRLQQAGPRHAATFSWERSAEQTLASYRRALGAAS